MNMIPNLLDIFSVLPALLLAGGGVVVICFSVLFKTKDFLIVRYVSGFILLIAFASVFYTAFRFPGNGVYFAGQIENSLLTFWLNLLYVSMAIGTAAVAPRILRNHKIEFPEFYPLLLFATSGMMLMTAAQDFILIFTALELMSLCLYILVGISKNDHFSLEATLKYFLLGSFSSGFMLMGIAFLFGGSGSTNVSACLQPLSVAGYQGNFAKIGLVLFLTGVSFKIALFPYHAWTPDAYEGALTPVTGYMATAAKAASMGLLLILYTKLPIRLEDSVWAWLTGILALCSMIYGNLLALKQENLKRMLAYSSIAHAGYIVAGISAGIREEVLFYLIVYSFMSLGAFAILAYLEEGTRQVTFFAVQSLSGVKPLTAIAINIFFMSLAGVPPFGGFWAKLFLFQKLAESDSLMNRILLIGGVTNSALALYYYLRIGIATFMSSDEGEISRNHSAPKSVGVIAVVVVCFFMVALGWLLLVPGNLLAIGAGQSLSY
ncbi:NADH-quinone oxidoreductase subunit N [Leptospira gomenensis]|uniref:NADH-quinone oxidoreductase subunit N n=1 Tax=Leptospira gomenensis TaxID=2484974 RepID=A0A5F1Y807_9LEPT|nr:NADH-quinone oxidoreductase subunit N [Leptospira gomenensis]TGK28989.1 NADH-quinone oxidoreductase subunit N [Leptospira gomenensis]TGK32812.1 NADH-quinone oxidoreductase subunit N [Leptospira gomenensis]TGK40748.1 NADH-quinone oxidoreductase subunit N [Leptospira gomenensis]TGK68408.1 NADH-quinone oxidoreductase subunit N [Leptospira gomenensis]